MIEPVTPDLVRQFDALFRGGTLSALGEGELLERFVRGRDEAAFEEIVARHGPMVLGVCRRWLDDPHDVEDAFQATFLVLVRKAAGLRDRDSVRPWLFGVAHRVARNARAAVARRRAGEGRNWIRSQSETVRSAGPDPTEELTGREILAMVDEEILRLPPRQREAAVLGLVQGMTHQAAAQALGWPLGTFKTRVAEARAKLARRLARRGVSPAFLGALGRSEGPLFPATAVQEGLARRTIDLAIGGTPAGAGSAMGAAVTLARRVSRGMMLSRVAPLVLAVVTACVLAAPAWSLANRQEIAHRPVIAQAGPASVPAPRVDRYGDLLPAGAVLRLGTIRYRQGSAIHRIAYTGDGQHLVTDGEDGKLRVWDVATGRVVRTIDPEVGPLNDFGLTSDGKTALIVGLWRDGARELMRRTAFIEVATGRVVRRASWPEPSPVAAVALCPDRGLVALLPFGDRVLVVRDARDGEELERTAMPGDYERIAFSPDGKWLAIELTGLDGNGFSRLMIRDVDREKEIRTITGTETGHGDLAFSPDGSLLAVPCSMYIGVWEVPTGKKVPLDDVFSRHVDFSADGRHLSGTFPLGRICTWDVVARRETRAFESGIELGASVALSPDGRTLASNGGPNVLHLWDLSGALNRSNGGHSHADRINALAFTPDGAKVLSASDDQTVRLWDLSDGRALKTFGHEERTSCLALSADGRRLVVATDMPTRLYLWDLAEDARPLAVTPDLKQYNPAALRFGEKDRSILELSGNGTICEWDLASPEVRQIRRLPELTREPRPDGGYWIYKGAFFDGGRMAALEAIPGGLHVVDLEDRKDVYGTDDDSAFAISPDQRTVAIAKRGAENAQKHAGARLNVIDRAQTSTSGTILLVDGRSGKETRSIAVPGSEVWALAFLRDGKTLAATSGWEAGRIHFYEVATGREIRRIDCPPLRSPALAFTPDGSRLVSGMADGSILVWEVRPPLSEPIP